MYLPGKGGLLDLSQTSVWFRFVVNEWGKEGLGELHAEMLRRLVEAGQVDAICLQVGALFPEGAFGKGWMVGGTWQQCACNWAGSLEVLVDAGEVELQYACSYT